MMQRTYEEISPDSVELRPGLVETIQPTESVRIVECHCARCEAARERRRRHNWVTQFLPNESARVERAASKESIREYHIEEYITKRGGELKADMAILESCVAAEGWEAPAVQWLERADGSAFVVLVMSRVRRAERANRVFPGPVDMSDFDGACVLDGRDQDGA